MQASILINKFSALITSTLLPVIILLKSETDGSANYFKSSLYNCNYVKRNITVNCITFLQIENTQFFPTCLRERPSNIEEKLSP